MASPFTRVSNFDAVGTIKTVEAGEHKIIPVEVVTPIRLKSKTIRDQAYKNNASASLQKTLNTISDSDDLINEVKSKTVTPFKAKHKSAVPEDLSKDIGHIHMYDTLILGKEPSPPPKPRNRSTIRRNLREKISRPKNMTIDVMPRADLFNASKTPNNKIVMRAINTGQLSPRAQ